MEPYPALNRVRAHSRACHWLALAAPVQRCQRCSHGGPSVQCTPAARMAGFRPGAHRTWSGARMRVGRCERAPHARAAAADCAAPRRTAGAGARGGVRAQHDRHAGQGSCQACPRVHESEPTRTHLVQPGPREVKGETGKGTHLVWPGPRTCRELAAGSPKEVSQAALEPPHRFGVPVPAAPPPPRARRASQNACWAARTASASRGCGQSCGAGGAGGALWVRRRAPASGMTRVLGRRGLAGRRGCM